MPEPTQVVRIIARLNIGGPAIQATSLTTALEPEGFRTLLVHGRLAPGEGDMRYLLAPGASVRFLPSLARAVAPLSDLRACWQIYTLLRRVRPRIVHTHTAKAGAVGRLATIAYNFTRQPNARARVVHTYHGHVLEGYFSRRSTAVFVAIERVLARWTDALVAISSRIQHELLDEHRIGRQQQFRVVPLGFDLAPFAAIDDAARRRARATMNLAPSAPVVTFAGRLTAIKQPRLFIEIARLVADRQPEATFLVVGDGDLRAETEALAVEGGLKDCVRFLGWRRDLDAIYAATDVFLLTSRNEGTPVAIIEAMAAGVPCVSTDVGGVRDVIDRADLGVLVPPGETRTIADAVCDLIDRPDVRRQMGARGRDSVIERYSLQRLVRDIAGLYRELLREDPMSQGQS